MEDSDGLNKDQRSRKKSNECKEQVGELVYMVLGDTSYTKVNWGKRINLVRKVMEQLKDPQYVLKLLRSMVIEENNSSGLDVEKTESALQELLSFVQLSKNIILNQDYANEIEGLQMTAKTLQEAKESTQFIGEELKQMKASSDQKHRSMWEAKVCSNVANELQRVVDSCMNIAAFNILNQDCANQVQGHHVVEIEGGQLRLAFPQNSIQINQKGKNAEVANQEMIVQEKQGNEVILTLQQVEGRLAGLKLAMKITNQDMKDLPAENCGSSLNLESISKYLMEGVTGTSNAATNEANVKLSPDETRIVRGYKVFNCNADVLDEIFQKHPNIVKNFRLAHPDLQSLFMNSLAEVYQKIITSKQEMLELNDIEIMELMVGDMEHNGLQLTWLNEMLKEVRERLEQEKKKLQGEIDMYKAKTKEAERRMAKLEKKPRLE